MGKKIQISCKVINILLDQSKLFPGSDVQGHNHYCFKVNTPPPPNPNKIMVGAFLMDNIYLLI